MRILSLTLIAASVLPVYAAGVPAKVDQALRTRVQEFYTAQVNRQYRQVESIVADDTKDLYFQSPKPDMKAFSIQGIEYSPNFKTAVVLVRRTINTFFMGAGVVSIDSTEHSKWKIEKGKWCWYIDPDTRLETPFGRRKPVPADADNTVGPLGPFQMPSAAALKGQAVQPDRMRIRLDAADPQPAMISLKNLLPGPVTIVLGTAPEGITTTIANQTIQASASTEVTVTPTPRKQGPPRRLRDHSTAVEPDNPDHHRLGPRKINRTYACANTYVLG